MTPEANLATGRGWNIAVLGAECTGKTSLAQALATEIHVALQASPGPVPQVAWVPEALRAWCVAHHRTPLAHEQAEVAQQQLALTAAARALVGPTGWLVVDTTPLQTAVYSHHYFADTALDDSTQHQQRDFDVTLLMGLDLPWQADGRLRDGPATQAAVDALLRQRLQAAGIRHHLVYGTGSARTAAALQAVALALPASSTAQAAFNSRAENLYGKSARAQKSLKLWPNCEACSDPDCEHLLFTRLLQQRQVGG